MKKNNAVIDFLPKPKTGTIAEHMRFVLEALGEDTQARGIARDAGTVGESVRIF